MSIQEKSQLIERKQDTIQENESSEMSMHTTISILDINGAYCKLQMMRTKFEQKLVNDIFSRANLLADHTLGLVPFHILSLHGTLQNKRCPHTKQKKRQPSLDKEMEVGWLQGCFYC